MTQSNDVFQYMNAVNRTTNRDIIRTADDPADAEKNYNPYLTNKGFSMYVDTVLAANEMNLRPHISNKMQYSYYINTIRPSKDRYSKWPKKEKLSNDMKVVMEFYNVGHRKAQEFLKVLTKEQVNLIRKRLIKGGISNELRSKSTDRGEII